MRSELHKHRCGSCGHVWQHDQQAGANLAAHICSRCGNLEILKYFGSEPPRLPYLKPPTEDHFP